MLLITNTYNSQQKTLERKKDHRLVKVDYVAERPYIRNLPEKFALSN